MRTILLYSALLIAGLITSQFLGEVGAYPIKLLTMFSLAFIMVHVGYEFELIKDRPRQYAWDYVVAATAAMFPWLFCAFYLVFVMAPQELWGHFDSWKEALLVGRFAAPTSAGVLFSMLAGAGLAATWVYHKARILAIFDDLDTILLMIPLIFLMVGFRWQLLGLVAVMLVLLYLAWRHLHAVPLPVSWPFVLGYAAAIALLCEWVYLGSKIIDKTAPIHLEVLLPAFVWGSMLARPRGRESHAEDQPEGHDELPPGPHEHLVATLVSACFMVLVGLSMPPIQTPANGQAEQSPLNYAGVAPETLAEKYDFPGWGLIAVHVLAMTCLSNVGKLFPMFCYRAQASFRERLAVSICMFPRGEVGAGILVLSLSYGIGGPAITVAVLSLALNLIGTGLIILAVKYLLTPASQSSPAESRPRHARVPAGVRHRSAMRQPR